MKKTHNQKKNLIHLFEPSIHNEDIIQTIKILKSKFWASGAGIGKVKFFEDNFSRYIGSRDTIAVNSGTAAIHLATSVLDIKNTEVLVPSLTFTSTANAALYNGAKPKFVDIDESTLCIDIDDLEKKISKKTKTIIPVHFGGIACDMQKIKKLKNDFNLNVIEDAAHACGTSLHNKKIGTHSDMVCFSFHPVKNLSMPSGGAICLNKKTSYGKKLRSLRWCGITNRKGSLYDVDDLGWNYYMDEISAGIGITQLQFLEKMNSIRKKFAKRYHKELNIQNKMPFIKDCSYHLYWIRVKNRKEFMKKMKTSNIETGIHYKPLHLMSLYKSAQKLPKVESIWKELVTIPLHPNLTNAQVDKIIECTNKFAKS